MRRFLALLILVLCSAPAFAYDFMAENQQGIAIYYDVLSESECAVTSNIIHDELWGSFHSNYIGDITIPAQVEYDGQVMNVVEIKESAFDYAYYLTSLTLPETMRKVVFSANSKGVEKVIFSSIESACNMDISLGVHFDGNFNVNGEIVSDLVIPESVTTINSHLFESCSSIKSVSFPSTFKAIEKGCFTAALERVEFADMETLFNLQIWKLEPGEPNSLYGYNSWNLTPFGRDYHIYVDGEEIIDLVVPDNVQDIPDYLFAGANYLQSVSFHDNVRSIGMATFMYCKELSQLKNIGSVKKIGEAAFLECEQLKGELALTNTQKIGGGAFCKCSALNSVDLPAIQDSLPNEVFYETNLQSVHLGENLTYLGSNTFYAVDKMKLDAKTPPKGTAGSIVMIYNTTVEVPYGCKFIYLSEYPWIHALKIVEEGELVDDTGEQEVKSCQPPIIEYQNRQLVFSSETPGAVYHYNIWVDDAGDGRLSLTGIVDLSATYKISVYASAAGHRDSTPTFATLCWLNSELDQEDSISLVTEANPVLVKVQGDMLLVEGAVGLNHIEFYALDGRYLGAEAVNGGQAAFQTTEPVVIVKMAGKTIKVAM